MSLRILFLTSECAPWSKTGGLGDVAAALPAALRALGHDVRLLMPAYPSVPVAQSLVVARIEALARLPEARLLETVLPTGVPAYLIDCPQLYSRGGGPYQGEDGRDWNDNALRFGQLARIGALLGSTATPLEWSPDVVHANDWQGALAATCLKFDRTARARSVVTVHNLAFQGLFPAGTERDLGLPPESYSLEGVEFHGQCGFLKGGLACADVLTTVSPTYAREIQQEALGMGLAGLLRHRSPVLHGILNGIDTALWDPARDPHLPQAYDSATPDRKSASKRALQAAMKLPPSNDPLFGLVSRFTDQKGIDLVVEAGAAIVARGAQVALLGSGDPALEAQAAALARAHPGKVGARIGFDEGLAHLVEGGADAFLMPSRFEPCGMNQMYSQRYGTLPIVRATGGLVDSVAPWNAATGQGAGFLFPDATAASLLGAVDAALQLWREPAQWRRAQGNGMARDFGWGPSASKYADVYLAAVTPRS